MKPDPTQTIEGRRVTPVGYVQQEQTRMLYLVDGKYFVQVNKMRDDYFIATRPAVTACSKAGGTADEALAELIRAAFTTEEEE